MRTLLLSLLVSVFITSACAVEPDLASATGDLDYFLKLDGVDGEPGEASAIRVIDTLTIFDDGTAKVAVLAACRTSRLCRPLELDGVRVAAGLAAPPQPPIFGEWALAGVDLDGRSWTGHVVLHPAGDADGVYALQLRGLSALAGRDVTSQLAVHPSRRSCEAPACDEALDGYACVPACTACTDPQCTKTIDLAEP